MIYMDVRKIIEILKSTLDSDSNIPLNKDTLLKDVGLDSLKFISFIVKIEEEFNIEINDSDLLFENFETVGKVLNTLEKYFASPTPLKKCLILDCDNVLWKGISGEEAISVDNEVKTFQTLLLELFNRGILLCLCSKNEPAFIDESLSSPDMLVSKDKFTVIKIGRTDKATYISEIAQELNLSVDSFVFADDSDYELGFVASSIPGITVVKVDYTNLSFMSKIKEVFSDTPETDINRTQQYREQKEREKEKYRCSNINEYNSSLETVAVCRYAKTNDIPRLSELSRRTNQFNLSDKHYTETELLKMFDDNNYRIFVLSVSDKYGDMGIVGMAILRKNVIEAFMLSCRAFDRGFESIIFGKLKEQQDNLYGVYISNGKNTRYSNFYRQNGVELI